MNLETPQPGTDISMSNENPLLEQEQADIQAQAGRVGTYRLLATLLCHAPKQAVLDHIAGLSDEFDEQDDMSVAFRSLIKTAREAVKEEVADEYQSLFIGLGRGELVPYGSWYQTGFLMEKPLGILRDDLAAFGYARQPEVKEPEDHIGFLCEVMATMIEDGVAFEEQKNFFEKHLGNWSAKFFEDLIHAESACFYVGVGRLGQGFIEFETAYYSMPS